MEWLWLPHYSTSSSIGFKIIILIYLPQKTSMRMLWWFLLTQMMRHPPLSKSQSKFQNKELLQLMPLEWISNYENFKKNSTLVIATEATFRKFADGTIKTFSGDQMRKDPLVEILLSSSQWWSLLEWQKRDYQSMLLNQIDRLSI